jgi:hypothetical protein
VAVASYNKTMEKQNGGQQGDAKILLKVNLSI